MPIHVEKKAIRALGVAESFSPKERFSTLAGVVMRSDLIIDGFAIGKTKVSGFDATESIEELFSKLRRNDINALILSGSVLSLYNIVDIDSLSEDIRIPVVALTFKKSKSDLERNIWAKFSPKIAKKKIELLKKLGRPSEFHLSTGYSIFQRSSGISAFDSKRLLERFTLQGAIPEPVRVARLLAKAVASTTR